MSMLSRKTTYDAFVMLLDLAETNGFPEDHEIEWHQERSEIVVKARNEIRQDIADFLSSCEENNGTD